MHRSFAFAAAALALSSCVLGASPKRRRAEPAPDRRPPLETKTEPIEIRPPLHRWDNADHLLMLPPESQRYDAIAASLAAKIVPVEEIFGQGGEAPLARFFGRLAELERAGQGNVRILHLGDSHVAADYITGTARRWLQYRFGDAGRGFVAVDQRLEYGGRRLERQGWKRTRIVDPQRPNSIFGFSGMSLESLRKGARVDFQLAPDDNEVAIYYLVHRGGAKVRVLVDERAIAELELRGEARASEAARVDVPPNELEPNKPRVLSLIADGPGAVVFGLSFEARKAGVLYDVVGPVGADARSYLSLDPDSFHEQLRALAPDLMILMVGGNDALMIRTGRRTLEEVRVDHEKLIASIKIAVPEADCLVWSPMDAGELVDGQIVSRRLVREVRDVQRSVSAKLGCGFWDMYESMGADGSFERWYKIGIMNDDLVHPRALAGELLGHLFATALVKTYGGPFVPR